MKKPEDAGVSAERLKRIDDVMERHLGQDRIAGAITVLYRRDDVVHFQCHGLMDREKSTPMRRDAIFRIFSMTKPITMVALLTLLEKGLVRLTDPASTFLPAMADLKVYDGGEGPDLKLVDCARPVTIRDLLTHTSGLTYHFGEDGPVEQMYRDRGTFAAKPLRQFVDDLLQLPLAFQPGSMWRYSLGHDVIARIVEIVSGLSFGDYITKTILEPLDMTDTGFSVPRDKQERYCAEYGFADVLEPGMTRTRLWAAGGLRPHLIRGAGQGPETRPNPPHRGGHGLVSTATDYLRFCRMLLGGGELDGSRILGPKTVELMTVNHLTDAQLPFGQMGPGWGFGLGVRVLMDLGQAQVLGSVGEHGWGGAAGTYYWIDPHEQLIGVHMKQFQPGAYFQDSADFRTAAYQAILD